jgi:hypothetical protein
MRARASTLLLFLVACGGTPQPKPAPTPAPGPAPEAVVEPPVSWVGEHALVLVAERGRPVSVPAEAYHMALSLNADGTYRLGEWENGRWQRQASGAYVRQGARLVLKGVAEGTDLTLLLHAADGERWACMGASREGTPPIGTFEGQHLVAETLREGARVKGAGIMNVVIDAQRMVVRDTDGEVAFEGPYTRHGALLMVGGEGHEPMAFGAWLEAGQLVLCGDLYQRQEPVAPTGAGS